MTMTKASAAVSFTIALLYFAGGSASSQELIRIDPRHYCAAEPGPVPETLFVLPPTATAERAVQEILDFIVMGTGGWSLFASAEDKASASIDPVTGERRIVYNEDFIDDLRGESESVWANVAILAHEVAHHLNNHLQVGDEEQRRVEELEADRFAGYILARKGASEEATQRVFRALGGGTDYHPPVRDRVAAARNGWLRAGQLGASVADVGRILADDAVTADVAAVAEEGDAGAELAALDDTIPRVSRLSLGVAHRPSVPHEGGGVPGPGMVFSVQGRLQYRGPAEVYVGVDFAFPDGRVLFANPQETYYRGLLDGRVATGTTRVPFSGGELNLGSLRIAPLPYWVLNLGPARYVNYSILARAAVYVDGLVVAASEAVPFFVVW